MRAGALWLMGLAWVVAVGCARQAPGPFEGRAHVMYPGRASDRYVAYRIGFGDELELSVQRHAEFSGKLLVETSGFITVPTSLDRVRAVNLSVSQLEEKISGALGPYLLTPPRVYVRVLNPNSRFVYVLGAVNSPGKYVMKDEHLDVREAVVRAGLPTQVAALNRTKLYSSSPDQSDVRTINLRKILRQGRLEENYELKPGDVIYVPNIYVWDISWWMIQVLRPFQLLVAYRETAQDLSTKPQWGGATGSP